MILQSGRNSETLRCSSLMSTGGRNLRSSFAPSKSCAIRTRGEARQGRTPFPSRKYLAVFHAPRTDDVQRGERAEAFFAATGATVRHTGKIAAYSPHFD